MDDRLIDAFTNLISLLVETYGAGGTLLILLGLVVFSYAWRLYKEKQRDKEYRLLIEEKDRTIRRLEKQEIMWRKNYLFEKGLTMEEVLYLVEKLPADNIMVSDLVEFMRSRQVKQSEQGEEDMKSKQDR